VINSGQGPAVASYAAYASNTSTPLTLTLTVTDSSPTPQSATIRMTLPPAPALSEPTLHTALLAHVAGLSDFASRLAAANQSPTFIQGLVLSRIAQLNQGQLTQAQYNAVTARAMQLRSNVNTYQSNYYAAIAPFHALGESAQSAAASLSATYAAASALPATYYGYLQSDLGPSFTVLDNYAWQYVAPQVLWCDPSQDQGCTCWSDPNGDCGNPPGGGGGAGSPVLSAYSEIEIDPASQQIQGTAQAWVSGYDSTQLLDPGTTSVDATMDGGTGIASVSIGPFAASEELWGKASSSGNYGIYANATVSGAMFTWGPYSDVAYAVSSTNYSPPSCTGPIIGGVEIMPSGSTQWQPTSGLMVGSSGTLKLNAACLDSSAQLSVDGSGVTLTSVTSSGASITASYSVDSSAPAGSRNLTLTTTSNGGSAGTTLEVASSLPFIDTISPSWWQTGQLNTVTITGAGFGGGSGIGATQGTIRITSQYNMNWSTISWTDNLIIGTVTPDANDPGENVTVSVNGGDYGMGFQSNQGKGVASSPGNATVGPSGQPAISVSASGTQLGRASPQHLAVTQGGLRLCRS